MALGPIRLEQDQTTAQLQVQKVSHWHSHFVLSEKNPQSLKVTGTEFLAIPSQVEWFRVMMVDRDLIL